VSTRPIAIVLPPEFDGATGYIDDVGGGHDFTAKSATPGAHAVAGVELAIGAACPPEQSYAYTYLKITKDGYRPYRQDAVRVFLGPVQIRIGVQEDPGRTAMGLQDTFLPALAPNIPQVSRALVGPLMVVHHPSAKTHSYADDTGPRRVLFCSNFCALRDFRDSRDLALSDLDIAVRAGYQGIRIFRILGESDTSGYFAGRAVLPEWSPDILVEYAYECQKRGLRLQLTSGHQWTSTTTRLAWERGWMRKLHAAGLDGVVALVEGDNEYWQNAWQRNSDAQIAEYGELAAIVRSTLSPAPFFACGAPENESPDLIYRASTHSDVCEIHTSRDVDKMVKRPFVTWYWEGDPGHFPKPYWHGEPTPFAGGPDDFMGTDNPGRQIAMFAIMQLTGGAVSYFDGWDVRSREPLDIDAQTFVTAPLFLSALPEDVATWGHVPGGNIWWWQGPGKRFATVVDEQWGPVSETLFPPKPLGAWKAYGPNNGVIDGQGTITRQHLPLGFGGALIVGEFV
jgi:hypothetical protein